MRTLHQHSIILKGSFTAGDSVKEEIIQGTKSSWGSLYSEDYKDSVGITAMGSCHGGKTGLNSYYNKEEWRFVAKE